MEDAEIAGVGEVFHEPGTHVRRSRRLFFLEAGGGGRDGGSGGFGGFGGFGGGGGRPGRHEQDLAELREMVESLDPPLLSVDVESPAETR